MKKLWLVKVLGQPNQSQPIRTIDIIICTSDISS
jgi:hypothetical protein